MKIDLCPAQPCYKDDSSATAASMATMRRGQRGMTLVIGLILLVMLTVIGLIGFRNTTLSERMTGNAVDRDTSFQSSESAGKEALQLIESVGFSPTSTTTAGYYTVPFTSGAGTAFWTQGDNASNTSCVAATTSFSWTNCSASVGAKYVVNSVQIKNKAQYAIELLSKVGSAAPYVYTYRVTSRSTGGSGDAEVVLQTLYPKTAP